MKDIFRNPTISQLAPVLKKVDRTADQSPVSGPVPLMPVQRSFFSSSPAEPHHFNMSVLLFSGEGFEEKAVRAVFGKIQAHHDALRMTCTIDEAESVQVNHGLDYPFSLDVFDFRNRDDAVAALEEKNREIQASIDLQKGPLMKLALFQLDDGHRLLVVIHHLVIDGVSWRILFEDIEMLFRQYRKGEPLKLPLKSDSFKVWSEKSTAYANSDLFLEEKRCWEEIERKIVPVIEKDFAEEINYSIDAAIVSSRLNEEETELLLTKVNEPFGTEINDILLTALGLAVKRSFHIEKVLVGLEGHGREEILDDVDISRTVGWFTTLVPFLAEINYADELGRQIKEIKEAYRRIPNKGIGYGILKYLTDPSRKEEIDFKLKPQISFNYMGQFDTELGKMSFQIARESMGDTVSKKSERDYELDVAGMLIGKQLEITITYNKKQYRRETVQALSDHFKSELERIISFCVSHDEKEITPSDLGYSGMTIDDLDSIFD
ncbi:MAG: hypothetical protein GY757_31085 [bacterium]|nr:hypothetical protein [bacterium]